MLHRAVVAEVDQHDGVAFANAGGLQMRHQPSRELGRAGDDPADIVGHAGGTAEGGLSGGARTAARELLDLPFGEEQLPGGHVDSLMILDRTTVVSGNKVSVRLALGGRCSLTN